MPIKAALVFIVIGLFSACGQKGDLYRPSSPQTQDSTAPKNGHFLIKKYNQPQKENQ